MGDLTDTRRVSPSDFVLWFFFVGVFAGIVPPLQVRNSECGLRSQPRKMETSLINKNISNNRPIHSNIQKRKACVKDH